MFVDSCFSLAFEVFFVSLALSSPIAPSGLSGSLPPVLLLAFWRYFDFEGDFRSPFRYLRRLESCESISKSEFESRGKSKSSFKRSIESSISCEKLSILSIILLATFKPSAEEKEMELFLTGFLFLRAGRRDRRSFRYRRLRSTEMGWMGSILTFGCIRIRSIESLVSSRSSSFPKFFMTCLATFEPSFEEAGFRSTLIRPGAFFGRWNDRGSEISLRPSSIEMLSSPEMGSIGSNLMSSFSSMWSTESEMSLEYRSKPFMTLSATFLPS